MNDTSTNKPVEIDEMELNRLNQEMIMSDLITPDRLYVDLALVKDYNIGTLLTFVEESKTTLSSSEYTIMYQTFLKKIPAYQNRYFDDIEYYFPELHITNKEFICRKHDKQWANRIFHNSPSTPFINTLQAQIAVNVNHSAVAGKRNTIKLVFNTYPLELNIANQNIVKMYFTELLKLEVDIICCEMSKVTLKEVLMYDELYIYFLSDLFSNAVVKEGYSALKFIRKRLFTPRIFGNVFLKELDLDTTENSIVAYCEILTMFKYINPKLCSARTP